MRLQQRLVEGDEIVSRDGCQRLAPSDGEMAVRVLTVERGEKLLKGISKAIFFQRVEFAELICLFAHHLVVGKRRVGEHIEEQLHAIDKCLFEKAGAHLQRIAIPNGPKRCPQAIDIVLDIGRAARLCAPVPNRGQQSDQTGFVRRLYPLPAVQHGPHGNERYFAIRLHHELAVVGQLNHRELCGGIGGHGVAMRRGGLIG